MEQRNYRKRSFWSAAGPLLGYWGIQMAVQFVAQLIIELPYIAQVYASVMTSDHGVSMDEVMDSYWAVMEPALEQVLRMQVEITGAAAACTLIMTGLLFAGDRRREREQNLPLWRQAPASSFWTLGVMGAAGCISATCLSVLAQAALYDAEYQQTMSLMYSASFPVQLILLGIVTPVAEEMMFRGVLFRRYRESMNFLQAALWSSMFFSLMHSSTIQMVYTFLLGLLLSYVYEKFGSIKAPVLLHVLLNTGSVLFTEIGLFDWMASDILRIGGGAVAGAFLCSVMFVRIQRMENQSSAEIF